MEEKNKKKDNKESLQEIIDNFTKTSSIINLQNLNLMKKRKNFLKNKDLF